jgi:hypothetical protein
MHAQCTFCVGTSASGTPVCGHQEATEYEALNSEALTSRFALTRLRENVILARFSSEARSLPGRGTVNGQDGHRTASRDLEKGRLPS